MTVIKNKIKEWGLLFSIIISCFAILIIILRGVDNFKHLTLDKKTEEVSYLTHLLTKQQANVFSVLIFHNAKESELQHKLNEFVKEDIVVNASLYTADGRLLASSYSKKDVLVNDQQKQDIVEPIYYKDNLEGFLRVNLNRTYLPQTLKNMNRSFNYLYAQEIILFLVGGLLMMSIYHFIFTVKGRKLKILANKINKENTNARHKVQKIVKKDISQGYKQKKRRRKNK